MVKIRNKNELKCLKIGLNRVGWYVCTLLILSSCAKYKVEIDNTIWGSNEQEIYTTEKQWDI